MLNHFTRTLAVAALSLSALGLSQQSSSAQGVELNLGPNGPELRLQERCDPRIDNCYGERAPRRQAPRFCTEDRALDKAERMGVRRADIVSANRRTIQVRGRNRDGERIRLTFGREPNCPVYR